MKIWRFHQDLGKYVHQGKALAIMGPRRAGKTTLLNDFLPQCGMKYKLDSGDDLRVRQFFSSEDIRLIKEYVAGYELVAIDEAQRIPNVGTGLKILVDHVPGIQDSAKTFAAR